MKPTSPRISLEVTQELIDQAIPRDSKHCMIAMAVETAYPGAKHVSVDLGSIRFSDHSKKLRYTYLTPRVVQAELLKFDRGAIVSPFKFMLRNAIVTRAGSGHPKRLLSPKQKEAAIGHAEKMHEALARTGLRVKIENGVANGVPNRIGGKTPPVQATKDGIPFSRRRAFGLRALEF